MIALRDASGLSQQVVTVPPNTYFLLSLLDGTHSLRDLQLAYLRQFGELLMTPQLQALVNQLDEALLLEGGRFEQAHAQAEQEFRDEPVRRATHAGQAYPEGREELTTLLDGLMRGVDRLRVAQGTPRALIAPHIDLQRGGPCFALAYRELAEAESLPNLFVVLGIAHSGPCTPLVLTHKDFETPLGRAQTDGEGVERIAQACSYDPFADEFLHRGEHSIEFQVLFLQYLLGEQEFRIVPILCGGFHRSNGDLADPASLPEVVESLRALREAIASCGTAVCLIAGADLSHVGTRFGDSRPLTLASLERIRVHDLEFMHAATELDAAGLYSSLAADKDRRNICGFPAIYALISLLGDQQVQGQLIHYDRALDRETNSVVSFASAVYW